MAVFTQIDGLPQVGALLVSNSTATNGELYQSVQWYANVNESTTGGSAISGATELTYTTTAAEEGKWIYAVGTFDDSGPLTADSNIIGPIGQGSSKSSRGRGNASTGNTEKSAKASSKASKGAPAPSAEKSTPADDGPKRMLRVKVDTSKWHPSRRPKKSK